MIRGRAGEAGLGAVLYVPSRRIGRAPRSDEARGGGPSAVRLLDETGPDLQGARVSTVPCVAHLLWAPMWAHNLLLIRRRLHSHMHPQAAGPGALRASSRVAPHGRVPGSDDARGGAVGSSAGRLDGGPGEVTALAK